MFLNIYFSETIDKTIGFTTKTSSYLFVVYENMVAEIDDDT